MRAVIPLYNEIHKVVSFFSKQLKFEKFLAKTGRKLALSIEQIISLAIFKQKNGIDSKRSLYETCQPNCSYKTLVVNMIRFAHLGTLILFLLMKINREHQHLVKHIDSTDIPVCLFKNANSHKVMQGIASFANSGKGTFFGLKLHLISDFKRQILAVRFASANVDEREIAVPLAGDLAGIFLADAGYISQKLSREFYQEHRRILLVHPRKNMKKLMTFWQEKLYQTRMLIELNFRSLKMFYGLVTSLPRSVGGYFANYIFSLLAYQII